MRPPKTFNAESPDGASAPNVPNSLEMLIATQHLIPTTTAPRFRFSTELAVASQFPCSTLGNRRDWDGRFATLPISLGDLLSLEEGLEHFLAEQVFERSKVDVLRNGVQDSVAGEDTERKDAMEVRV